MKFIDSIRKMSSEVIDDLKWPYRVKTIERAAESLIGSVDILKIDTEQAIINLRKELTSVKDENQAKEIFQKIGEAQLKLEETRHFADIIASEKATLFGDAPSETVSPVGFAAQ